MLNKSSILLLVSAVLSVTAAPMPYVLQAGEKPNCNCIGSCKRAIAGCPANSPVGSGRGQSLLQPHKPGDAPQLQLNSPLNNRDAPDDHPHPDAQGWPHTNEAQDHGVDNADPSQSGAHHAHDRRHELAPGEHPDSPPPPFGAVDLRRDVHDDHSIDGERKGIWAHHPADQVDKRRILHPGEKPDAYLPPGAVDKRHILLPGEHPDTNLPPGAVDKRHVLAPGEKPDEHLPPGAIDLRRDNHDDQHDDQNNQDQHDQNDKPPPHSIGDGLERIANAQEHPHTKRLAVPAGTPPMKNCIGECL